MKLPNDKLMPVQSPLYGFNGEIVVHERIIILPMMLGTPLCHLNPMFNFMVVKVPFAYNMILGRQCMRMTNVVLSPIWS